MLTENGTIKARASLDGKMQKELTAGANGMSLAMIIAGAAGTAVFAVLYAISDIVFRSADDYYFIFMLIVFAALLGGGIGLKILVNRNIKAACSVNKINEYEFFKSYFIATETVNGEAVGTVKIYAGQIIKVRESKNYVFLYLNAAAVYPVDKNGLNEAEITAVKNIFRSSEGGAPSPASSQGVPPHTDEPEDPFSEFK